MVNWSDGENLLSLQRYETQNFPETHHIFFLYLLQSPLVTMNFSEEQILALAPDDSSKKSGRELANPSKWGKREISERAVWGECQGSGKLPYQAQVDLVNIAFKCSCPSRKFPCKHGLGLLLLYARDKKLFSHAAEPNWVTDWLDKRSEREEKKTEKKEKEKKADPAAQAKRQENRLKRVEDGTADLRLWIQDIIRNGLINIPGKDPSYFDNVSRRMVDAQAPGLAGMVRSLGNINFFVEGWQTSFLDQLIRIFLVLEGFSRLDQLPDDMQDELKTLIGFTQNQDELKHESGIRDEWVVLAKRTEKEENLTTERNWLYGTQSKKYALILQFYVKGQLPEANLVPGSCLDAELVFYSGINSMRALIKAQHNLVAQKALIGFSSWSEVVSAAGAAYASNPWGTSVPAIVENVTPMLISGQRILKDEQGEAVTISNRFEDIWKLLSLSGGGPIRLFAVGREQTFEPLSAWVDNQYISLS